MNILFLSEQFYPHGGGAELATYLYAKLLSESSVNVKVITNRFSSEQEKSRSGRLEVFRVPLFKDASALKYSMLRRLDILLSSFLRRMVRWADVVYIPLYWYSAIPVAKAYGKPIVTHMHNYILTCPLGILYNYSENRVCNRHRPLLCPPSCIIAYEKANGSRHSEVAISALLNSFGGNYLTKLAAISDAIICVSKAQRRVIIQGCAKLDHRKLRQIYNPLPEVPHVESVGDAFGYFGGPSRTKGFSTLRNAVEIINQYRCNGLRIHVTKFPNIPETIMAALNRMGFILHGKLSELEYEKVYREIRSVIVPSVWQEPLPYVVIEALLKGRIVIASEIGGIPEITKGCNGAFMFQAGNYEQLVEKMHVARDLNAEEAIELGIRNREKVMRKFGNEQTIQEFKSLLIEVAYGYSH